MTKVCEICGKEFAVTNRNQSKKICSLACRIQKHRMTTIRSNIKTALKELGLEAHGNQIATHYAHARKKHPYFCDIITCLSESGADTHLDIYRSTLRAEANNDCVEADTVLMCEFYEVLQAYTHGDTANAVEECYDAIAVLLRIIDVLEGRQELGKHAAKKNQKNSFSVLSTEMKIWYNIGVNGRKVLPTKERKRKNEYLYNGTRNT